MKADGSRHKPDDVRRGEVTLDFKSLMKIFVKAHPRAKKPRLIQIDETHFEVWVSQVPEDGKANRAIIEALADHLNTSKSLLALIAGDKSKNKTFLVSTRNRRRLPGPRNFL